MAASAINTVGSLDIGTFLKIVSTKGVYTNLPKASELWTYMQKIKSGNPEGREQRWNIVADRGQSAAQFVAAGDEGAFPAAHRSAPQEAKAYFKEFAATINVPRHLLNKQGSELAAYADSFGYEVEAKMTSIARMLSRALPGNGSGVLGKVSSVSNSGTTSLVTLSTATADAGFSHINWMEIGEKVLVVAPDSTARRVDTANTAVSYFKVNSKGRDTDIVTLTAYDSSDAVITPDGGNEIVSGDYIRPLGDAATDLSAIAIDYGLLSLAFAGLESLGADDGRTVHNLTMSGALGGSRLDASADTIDRSHFQSALSLVKERTSGHDYKYDKAFMFTTVYDALIDSWETDRVINSASDTTMGAKGVLGFSHGRDFVEFAPDEFTQKTRIWMPPKGDALQYVGTGVDRVSVGGASEFMPTNTTTGTHQRAVNAYVEGSGYLRTTHPAALCCIENFSL
jgi:hypothetical protein